MSASLAKSFGVECCAAACIAVAKHAGRLISCSLEIPDHRSAHRTRNAIQIENMRLFSLLAFIFDIDGTLVDSNELHVDSWDRAFRRFGKNFSREQLRAQIGKGSDQYLPAFLTPEEIKRFGKKLDEYRSELFREEYLPKVRPFPKVRELFQCIRDDNKRSVLASSGKKADTEYYIDLLNIGDLIDGFVSGDDAEKSKPAPDIFASSLKKLGDVSPADAVTIGDTRFDIEGAKKADLRTIAFLCGGTAESVLCRAGAIAIYRDPADFLAHYRELVAGTAAAVKT